MLLQFVYMHSSKIQLITLYTPSPYLCIHTALIETAYHPDNCYHNCTHAADVTQALHCLISEPTVRIDCIGISEIEQLYTPY